MVGLVLLFYCKFGLEGLEPVICLLLAFVWSSSLPAFPIPNSLPLLFFSPLTSLHFCHLPYALIPFLAFIFPLVIWFPFHLRSQFSSSILFFFSSFFHNPKPKSIRTLWSMQQDKSVVFRGLVKIRLIIFHVGWRLLPMRNGSSGEGERTGRGGGGGKRNVVGKEKCPKWREQIRQQENGKGNINSIYNPCDKTVTLECLSACYWEVILFIHTDPIGGWLGIMGNVGYYKDLERYYRASGELSVLHSFRTNLIVCTRCHSQGE